MYPGCFKMTESEMRIAADNRKIAFREQQRLLEIVAPKVIAPFAGDFAWFADKYFHQNWANRTTPKLLENLVNEKYAGKDISIILMQPGDYWCKNSGHVKMGRRVKWEDFLDEIRTVKQIMQPKVEKIERYIKEASLENLHERTKKHLAIIQKNITRDYIDFSSRFRFSITGEAGNFSFVAEANPTDGLRFLLEDTQKVDQTLYVDQYVWASILEGSLMFNIIQWVGVAEQNEFTTDMGRFWFWLEYHVDLNSKNIQAIICEELWPNVKNRIRPDHATFGMQDELSKIDKWYA